MSHDHPSVSRIRAELAALPEVPMPPEVAARIRRALHEPAAEWTRAPSARPGRTNAPLVRRVGRPTARRMWAPLAAALLVGVVLVDMTRNEQPQPVGTVDDLRTAGSAAFGQDGAGELADPVRRKVCLTAAGVADPGAALVGGTPYVVDGTPGTLLVLGDRQVGRYRIVVVDGACRRTLAETTAGR